MIGCFSPKCTLEVVINVWLIIVILKVCTIQFSSEEPEIFIISFCREADCKDFLTNVCNKNIIKYNKNIYFVMYDLTCKP